MATREDSLGTLARLPQEILDKIWESYIEIGIPPPIPNDQLKEPVTIKIAITECRVPTNVINLHQALLHTAALYHTSRGVREQIRDSLTQCFKIEGLWIPYSHMRHPDPHESEDKNLLNVYVDLVSRIRNLLMPLYLPPWGVREFMEYIHSNLTVLRSITMLGEGAAIIEEWPYHTVEVTWEEFHDAEGLKVWGSDHNVSHVLGFFANRDSGVREKILHAGSEPEGGHHLMSSQTMFQESRYKT
ncbi:MAG: hypothetical protein M1831_000792 [Alyxoria varia]|nr:MAG: hypothetical protein M1831_000792 [Alyxoria varia]